MFTAILSGFTLIGYYMLIGAGMYLGYSAASYLLYNSRKLVAVVTGDINDF